MSILIKFINHQMDDDGENKCREKKEYNLMLILRIIQRSAEQMECREKRLSLMRQERRLHTPTITVSCDAVKKLERR